MNKSKDNKSIFTINATRCKRCGGILTSSFGLQKGYGQCCMRKKKEEEKQIRNQLMLEGFITDEEV